MEEQQQSAEEKLNASTEIESLDSQSTSISTNNLSNIPAQISPIPPKKYIFKRIARRINIWLLLFILALIIAGLITYISYTQTKKTNNNSNSTTTSLSQEDIDKLRQTDVKVGDPKQILSVESNAIFAGKVLVRDNLEVAGQIKVSSPINLTSLSVSGESNMNKVLATNIQSSGGATIQGQFNVQGNGNISGNFSVGGTLTSSKLSIESLSLTNDLQLSKHIDIVGATPSSNGGSALGTGGTTSVSGSDTAGTININTGSNTGPGCFVTVNFNQRFNSPHVSITPIGSSASNINYYVNRSATNFSVCTTNSAPTGQNFAFDYIVID